VRGKLNISARRRRHCSSLAPLHRLFRSARMPIGAVFTLADLAFAVASNSHGVMAVACQADVTFFKAVEFGKLSATAEEIARTRKLSTCVIGVSDDKEELVALFKGVAYIKGTPLPA
jgi:acyl-CoA thioesterase